MEPAVEGGVLAEPEQEVPSIPHVPVALATGTLAHETPLMVVASKRHGLVPLPLGMAPKATRTELN